MKTPQVNPYPVKTEQKQGISLSRDMTEFLKTWMKDQPLKSESFIDNVVRGAEGKKGVLGKQVRSLRKVTAGEKLEAVMS
jgi:hypothetical protein